MIGIARFKVLQHYRTAGQDRLVFDEELLGAFTKHYEDAAKLGKTPQRISKQLYMIRRALERCIGQRLKSEGGAA